MINIDQWWPFDITSLTLHDFALLMMTLEKSWDLLRLFGDFWWVHVGYCGFIWILFDSLMYQRGAPPVPPMLHTFLWTICKMMFIDFLISLLILVGFSNVSKGTTPLYPLGFIHFWNTFCQDFLGEQTPVADARRPVVHSGAMVMICHDNIW